MDQRERIFRDHFEQTFKNAEIKLIQIKESVLFDEFDVMTVMIVYDSPEELDLDGTVSFVGDILPKLHEINDYRFPAMRFVEYDDYMANTPSDLLVEC
ncbi:MAG: hypothetical protein F4069_03375 [Rhodothermaceae bacterium]|nr:hypothetical protein [Bacteroidota bacterium]MXW32855.1 hypothetical protein [Rhodothermaceae bacterium]MXZ17792.1 hypothetical protein [Rhodothermaceae bacterium]MYE63536.1 hypothetical protein [Rhodothermaceae bacterium]MYG68676.1 hypothetical protein [Rhodothermaceae bacterium]